jgi:hypothetical protein
MKNHLEKAIMPAGRGITTGRQHPVQQMRPMIAFLLQFLDFSLRIQNGTARAAG